MAATTLLPTPAAGQLEAQGAGGEQLVELGLDAHRADRATLVHHSLAELVDHVRRRADRIPAYRHCSPSSASHRERSQTTPGRATPSCTNSVSTAGLPTQRECLELLDCYGTGKVHKLAEIVAGTVLCGELS